MKNSEIVVIIPALNESKTIASIVSRTKKFAGAVIVIDDGSEDGTGEIAKKEGALVLRHSIPTGAGGAMFNGINLAKMFGKTTISLDADGQHFPEDIPALLEPIENGRADFVIGYRFSSMKQVGLSLYKRLLNSVASMVASWICGMEIRDSETGFRAYNRKALEALTFDSMDYGWATESLINLGRKKLRMAEVPIKTVWGITPRAGQSRRGFIYGMKVLFRFLWRYF